MIKCVLLINFPILVSLLHTQSFRDLGHWGCWGWGLVGWLAVPSCRPSRYFSTLYKTKSSCNLKVLNVAEKNDAAKNIANIMSQGATNRREGFSPYNKIYEFGYMVQVNFPIFGWGSLQCLVFRVSRLRW